jgi:hypothetical protein
MVMVTYRKVSKWRSSASNYASNRFNIFLDSRRSCYTGIGEISCLTFSWSSFKTCGFFTYIFSFCVPQKQKSQGFQSGVADATILSLRLIVPGTSIQLFAVCALAFTWIKCTYGFLHQSVGRRRVADLTSHNFRNLSFLKTTRVQLSPAHLLVMSPNV